MKCKACGYEHEGHYAEGNNYVTTKGDIPFLEISDSMAIKEKDKFDKTQILITTKLYACPKCGTVRINWNKSCNENHEKLETLQGKAKEVVAGYVSDGFFLSPSEKRIINAIKQAESYSDISEQLRDSFINLCKEWGYEINEKSI